MMANLFMLLKLRSGIKLTGSHSNTGYNVFDVTVGPQRAGGRASVSLKDVGGTMPWR